MSIASARKTSIEKNIENSLILGIPAGKKHASPPPPLVQGVTARDVSQQKQQQSPISVSDEKSRLIIWNEYEQLELIGGGSFGHVYRCRHIKSGQIYAIKKFKNKYQNKKKAFDQREIQILQRFSELDKKGSHCPFVMKAERIEFENRKLFIVFKQMDMSLTQYIKKKGKKGLMQLNEQSEIRVLMRQIMQGMQYLNEELGILHRDLKPDNIMVNENPLMARIIDFGTCKDLSVESGPHTSYVSTRWYRAPECVLRSHHYNFNSDIFAAGCVMAEMYLQHPLFPGVSELDQIDRIFQILGTPKKDQWREGYRLAEKREIVFNDYPKKNLQKHLPGIGDDALQAVKFMLKISGQKRGNASDILQLPFFKMTQDQTPTTQETYSMQSPQYTIKAPHNKSATRTMSDTTSLMHIKESSNTKLDQIGITTIPEINSKNGENELVESPSSTAPKLNVPEQIDSGKLDTIVPMGVVSTTKQNRYKTNKYLNDIEEEDEKKLPVLPKAPVIAPINPAGPSLRSTMYKNLYGLNNGNSQVSLNKIPDNQSNQFTIQKRDPSPALNFGTIRQVQIPQQKPTVYQKSFYNSISQNNQQMQPQQISPQSSVSNLNKTKINLKQNFNSTINFGQFQVGNNSQLAQSKKFAPQKTNQFTQGRNSDAQFQKKQQINFHGPHLVQSKNPHYLKLSDRLHSNLMIDANSTFMAIERSRSGINAIQSQISPNQSPMGQQQSSMFASTIQRQNRSLKTNKMHVPAHMNIVLENSPSLRSTKVGDFMSPQNKSFRIPMITLHGQPFLSPKQTQRKPGAGASEFSSTFHNIPSIGSANKNLTNQINTQLERSNIKLQIINEKRNATNMRTTLNNSHLKSPSPVSAFPRQTQYNVNFNVNGSN